MTAHWTLTNGQHTYAVPSFEVPAIQEQLDALASDDGERVVTFVPIGATEPVEITCTTETLLHSPSGQIV